VFNAKANYPGNNISGEASTAINFGAPPLSITSSRNGCNGSYRIWNIVNNTPNNGTNWYWTVGYLGSNSQITIFSPSSPSTMLSVKGGGTVNLSYIDLCGVTRMSGITVDGGGCFGFRIAVSPNPSQSNMSVSLTPENSSNQSITNAATATINNTPIKIIPSAGKTIMSLFEVNSNILVKQWVHNEASNLNYNFNINGLRKGFYILQIDRDNTATTTKVIIE
jgi:bacillolysin